VGTRDPPQGSGSLEQAAGQRIQRMPAREPGMGRKEQTGEGSGFGSVDMSAVLLLVLSSRSEERFERRTAEATHRSGIGTVLQRGWPVAAASQGLSLSRS